MQFTAQNLQICYSFTHVQIMHMNTRYYAQDALYTQDAYATFYNFFSRVQILSVLYAPPVGLNRVRLPSTLLAF